MDCVLPFRLRSAPKFFNAIADALQWILLSKGINHIYHYLDDYICVTPPSAPPVTHSIIPVCDALGVPLAMEKVEGPCTVLSFLGIELDTMSLQMRVPADKLHKVKDVVSHWLQRRKACKKRELQSLVGLLNHACKVVRPGRLFLRRLVETMETAKHAVHWVRLNTSFRSDLVWWSNFIEDWNGTSMLLSRQAASSSLTRHQ